MCVSKVGKPRLTKWAICFLYLARLSHCTLPWSCGHLSLWPCNVSLPKNQHWKGRSSRSLCYLNSSIFFKNLKVSLPPSFSSSLSLSPSLSPCLNALALPSSNETLQCSLSRPHNKEEKLSPRCSYLFPSQKKKVAKTLRERKKVLHQKNMATVITRPLWNPIYLAKHLYFKKKEKKDLKSIT